MTPLQSRSWTIGGANASKRPKRKGWPNDNSWLSNSASWQRSSQHKREAKSYCSSHPLWKLKAFQRRMHSWSWRNCLKIILALRRFTVKAQKLKSRSRALTRPSLQWWAWIGLRLTSKATSLKSRLSEDGSKLINFLNHFVLLSVFLSSQDRLCHFLQMVFARPPREFRPTHHPDGQKENTLHRHSL